MILPTKHIRPANSLIGTGGQLLHLLQEPKGVSSLWERVRTREPALSFERFVLALDFLFIIAAIEMQQGTIRKARK
jgi:hypothetical protein